MITIAIGVLMKQDVGISLRPVKENDVEELYFLLNGLSDQAKQFFHPHKFDKETIKNICLRKKECYYVMILDNHIIGYSMLRFFGYKIPSYGCCIHQNYQEQNYGVILTNWTLERAKEMGCKKVILKVYKDNIKAFNLYKKIGFQIESEISETNEIKMFINLD